MTTVWTIGHSRTPFDEFVVQLRAAGIEALVDVRSQPYSRHAPHTARERLGPALQAAGIEYVYMGDRLGGRPSDPAMMNECGEPDYDKMAASPNFANAMNELLRLASRRPTCIMCAEEDPEHCHRTRLIAPVLLERGATLQHIRRSGRIESHATLF